LRRSASIAQLSKGSAIAEREDSPMRLKLVSVVAVMAACASFAAVAFAAVGSSVTLKATLSGGKVSSAAAVCKRHRKVVVKQKTGNGKITVFGRDTTNNQGVYDIGFEIPNGPRPWKFWAIAKPKDPQGPIVCSAARSATRTVD
jgi:hypothetical protein